MIHAVIQNRLPPVRKSREGASHPDRNAQFEHVNKTATTFLQGTARPANIARHSRVKKRFIVATFCSSKAA